MAVLAVIADTLIPAGVGVGISIRSRVVGRSDAAEGSSAAFPASCKELGLTDGGHLEDAELGGFLLCR
eukprot:4669442-Alexandrium_andersonii.AAC.1